jgi:hypothetical protein
MPLLMRIAEAGEWLMYRIGGLPVAIRAGSQEGKTPADVIRRVCARHYWRPSSAYGYVEIGAAWLLWPVVLLLGSFWYTAKNGRITSRRHGRSVAAQFADQLRLYFSDGLIAPWYYIFELAKEPTHGRAEMYLQRCETKAGIYPLLRRGVSSELNDKMKFAELCDQRGVKTVPCILYLDGRGSSARLPDCDLFVKVANGRGGRGAERWDRVRARVFASPDGKELSSGDLRDRLEERARKQPLIVQRRLEPHPGLLDLTTGALPTLRITTCLDEHGDPEIVSAVFRMSIGTNRTVDNLHAGGIASGVSLNDGTLSAASNLGMDASLGWLEEHPDTRATIVGRKLPLWEQTKALAIQAQRAFDDRVLVGWDVAITDDGPVVVEGNSSPDLDITQRFGEPVCATRFGELLAWNLRNRGFD